MNDAKLSAQIKRMVEEIIEAPSGAPPDFSPGGADLLDNVTWVDFTEIRYALEPAPAPTTTPTATLNPNEVETLIQAEAGGADTRDYLWFYSELKQRVFSGVWDAAVAALPTSHAIITIDAANGTVTYQYETIPMQSGQPQPVTYEQAVTYNVRAIVDEIMLKLPMDYAADFADIYYGITDESTSDAFFARQRVFQIVEFHFRSGMYFATGYRVNRHYQFSGTSDLAEAWPKLRDKLIGAFGEGQQQLGVGLDQYVYVPPPAPPTYSFMTFPEGEFNLGLRFVYRQEWRPLGVQRGEIVKTIPLGPGESLKVSTSIVRRTKVARTSESLRSSETTSETTDTTKNSSEVVDEAARSMKWNINQEVEGGYNAGVWNISGKTTGGISSESSDRNRQMTSHLSETVQKVASRLRLETKVVVSTESESTFQASSASEIRNANDEISVTYVYRPLQQQYEVLTRLAEIQNVVMIAERLPAPADVGFEWVKQHDWIIARVLLDDSYRDALSSISQQVPGPKLADMLRELKATKDDTVRHLGSFTTNANNLTATNIDIAEHAQENYRQGLERQIELLKQNYELDAKRERLYEHIRDNILHYCRAIWSQEDPQQRLLRYRGMGVQVPLKWDFVPDNAVDWTQALRSSNTVVPGEFVSDANGPTADLPDLINPAGPIGYYGNYAMYYVRPEYVTNDYLRVFEIFKEPYLFHDRQTGQAILMDPLQIELTRRYPPGRVSKAMIDAARDEMISYVPELRLAHQAAKAQDDKALKAFFVDYALFRVHYAEYLFRKEQSRRFAVDTNNLVVDLMTGEGSVLEPFKKAHRGIDVLKANAERETVVIENERRQARIGKKNYEDPDTERVIIVDSRNGTGRQAAAAAAGGGRR